MTAPCILPGSVDADSCYWCYMCKEEVTKHVGDGHITIRHAGFIEHLARPEHLVKTDRFWKDYRLDRALKLKYVVTQDDYSSFKSALEEALDLYEEQQNTDIAKRAAEIRKAEIVRQKILCQNEVGQRIGDESYGAVSTPYTQEISGNHGNKGGGDEGPGCSHWDNSQYSKPSSSQHNQSSSNQTSSHGNQGNSSSQQTSGHTSQGSISRRVTSSVLNSGGLTSIGVQKLRPGEGNIHTGATPPWLLDDEDKDTHTVGPSLEDFNKHLERERKRKLNPNRVGANFDHVTPTRDEWLPSFGRVWNHGRRWQSRHQFKKETDQTPSKKTKHEGPPATLTKPP